VVIGQRQHGGTYWRFHEPASQVEVSAARFPIRMRANEFRLEPVQRGLGCSVGGADYLNHRPVAAGHARGSFDSDSPHVGWLPNSLRTACFGRPLFCHGSSPPNRLVSPRSRPVRGLMHTRIWCYLAAAGAAVSRSLHAIASHCPAGSGPGAVTCAWRWPSWKRPPPPQALPLRTASAASM